MNRIIGKKAPDFHLKAVSGDGEDFFDVSLDTYKGHWLVLFFYPMDFTFVCPTEITTFSNDLYLFDEADAKLLAVSTDSEYTHQAWIRNGLGRIGYPLGADKTLSMAADYGVLLEDQGVALRGLFIIDPDQTIRYSVIHDNNIGRNPEEVLRVLAALKTGGLCAAGWKAGEENLRPDMAEREAPVLAGTAPVRIYTMPGCSYCRSVKEFLRQGGISYEEINLAEDKAGQAFMESRGYTGLPVTVIGAEEIVGYNMTRIKAALGLSGANEVK